MIVYCECRDCRYNDQDGKCSLDNIDIETTFYEDSPASCGSYEEKE